MARFLFVVPPLVGHVNPTVAVGHELDRRGHRVAWAGDRRLVGPLLEKGAELISVGDELSEDVVAAARARSSGLRGVAAFQFLWEDLLCPLAVAMVPGVEQAVDAFGPDVLIVDQQALAGAVVARRRGLPWATSATTSAELVDPFATLVKLGEWVRNQLFEFQLRVGVDAATAASGDLRFSPHLVIAFTTAELAGPPEGLPDGTGKIAMVGLSTRGRQAVASARVAQDFPWAWLEAVSPRVLVTLGTVSAGAGQRFFSAAAEAIASMPWRAVFVAPPDIIDPVPPNVLIRTEVPQLALLEKVDAVVCHAGHNTVCETLARGLPLVVAPIRDDQPIIADQVVRTGAGLRVRFGRVRSEDLRSAIDSILTQPAFRDAAVRVKASFDAAGGATAAADRLEELAA